ncbi:MAG: undecaprenyl/decaprenyl-phosphate alpha-N-acetylglucosaminyl 1-phosphate transferase [Planctomycetaceae bacterium]|nr:undecaprenyl/decaprenyl-phosphate alpha-N-acetylglucosaminyl 1-phosphate transferase [Planctomycetaceae bacterium]
MIIFIVGTYMSAFLVSVVGTPIIRRLAPALGLVDQPGHRKVHSNPTPMGGGIAVFLGLLIPGIVLTCSANFTGAWEIVQRMLDDLQSATGLKKQIMAISAGATVLFLTGLADDRWNLSWKPRLGIQFLTALFVVFSGVQATLFVNQPWIGIALTVLWIMVLTNAMNFLDNMDGLSAGIGVIASLMSAAILLLMVREPHWAVAFLLLLLSGSLSGFLCWNRPPASIFMGDSGSNLIGFLLATLTVSGTFYERTGSRHVILAPLCILAIPLYDFVTVILIRLKAGRSPFHGDKSHFSHRLVELGLRPARAVLTIHLATLMTGLGALLLYKVQDWTGALLIIALILCILSLVSILETVGRKSLARHVNPAAPPNISETNHEAPVSPACQS